MRKYFGQRIKRTEDPRLLTGQALFVDDVHLPGMLHAAFVRSHHAHGRIKRIDYQAALQRPGVVAVFTAESLGDYWKPGPLLVPPPPIERLTFNPRTHVPLARDKVRHVGEPIALVIATDRYVAEDAVEDVWVEIEPLDAVVDLERALQPGSVLIHEDLGSNVAARVVQERGDYQAARSRADVVLRRRLHYDRGTAAALENRGLVASWDAKAQHMTVWDTTQAPVMIRNGLAAMLGLPGSHIRVIAPFIGGGFGPKVMMFYPEEVLIPWAARKLNRPVKWIEDRQENFFATTQERGQIHDAEIALTRDGVLLGVKDWFLHDTGAYNPYGLTVPINSQCTLLGCYRIPSYSSEFTVLFTNKPMVTPFRGAGRQHGVFVIERLLDIAARELGLDRVDIRRRNLVPPDSFPYRNEIIFQDFIPLVYDSGNYVAGLDKAAALIDYERFVRHEQPRLRAQGKHVGIGLVTYVEGTGIGPYEGARITVENSGRVSVATGVGTQGQGHYTSFAQIIADVLGVDVRDIELVTGDTSEFHWGAGTFASRGAVVAGNACHAAALKVRAKILKLAALRLQVEESALELAEGRARLVAQPEIGISLGELAALANPLRGAVDADAEPGLEATAYFGPESGTTASGAHAMIVEVDIETLSVTIQKYVAVHDSGPAINPQIVEGQVRGGVAQGIGNAFYEKLHWNEQGQLLNATLVDYLLPTATDVPRIEVDHVETPSPLNPLGIKGVGEAGAIPVGALFAQAVEDALRDYEIEILEIPLSPNALFELTAAGPREGQGAGSQRGAS